MNWDEMNAENKKKIRKYIEEEDRVYDECFSTKPIEFENYKIKMHRLMIEYIKELITLLEQGDDNIKESCNKCILNHEKGIKRYEGMIKMYEERMKEHQLKDQYKEE